MHASKSRSCDAFTRVELAVVIVTLAALLVLVLTEQHSAKSKAQAQQCAKALQSVGIAFRQWAIDGSDKFPMQHPTAQGGSREFATNGAIYFTFAVMSNEINTPKILICPSDTRKPATDFGPAFANSNLSYFVGVTAEETQPAMLLMGDRNLTNGPLSANRLLLLTTNSAPGWDQQIHKLRGNVALSDGSVQTSTSTLRLRTMVTNSEADNLLAFP